MRRPLSILIAVALLFCALPAERAGALNTAPAGEAFSSDATTSTPSSGIFPAQEAASDAQLQEAASSGALYVQPAASDALLQAGVSSNAALHEEAASPVPSDARPAQSAFSFSSYRGTGIFQAGSLAGPQSLPEQASPFRLRSSSVIDPATTLYNDIVWAMHNEKPQSIPAGSDALFSIPVSVPAGAYPFPESDRAARLASMDAIYYVYAQAINDYPDFFYFIPDVEFAATVGSDAYIAILYMRVNEAAYGEKAAYEEEKAAMRSAAFPQGTQGLTQTEIALALHDYLALHMSYHTAAANTALLDEVYDLYPAAFSAYGAIVKKQAVCHGLSLAYKSLLADFGIESWIVADYKIGHAWSLLRLEDGVCYHVDLTHALGDAFALEGQVLHERFLLSDAEAEVALSTQRSDWQGGLPTAARTHPQRAFWADIYTAMYPIGGQWYYNDGKGGAGNLQRSVFGAKRTAATLYKNVGPVLRTGDKLYFYDYGDTGIYAYSPALNLRTLRTTVPAGLGSALSTGAAAQKTALAIEEIHYTLPNGNPFTFYAGESLGDTNGDGACNVLDVLYVLIRLDGQDVLYKDSLPRANVVWDACIDENDARRIAEMAVGLAA